MWVNDTLCTNRMFQAGKPYKKHSSVTQLNLNNSVDWLNIAGKHAIKSPVIDEP